jgi:hypothetical protein
MKVYTGTEKIESLNCLNRLLQEILGCAPAIILTIFFCKVKIFALLEELYPTSYSILYNKVKICTVN